MPISDEITNNVSSFRRSYRPPYIRPPLLHLLPFSPTYCTLPQSGPWSGSRKAIPNNGKLWLRCGQLWSVVVSWGPLWSVEARCGSVVVCWGPLWSVVVISHTVFRQVMRWLPHGGCALTSKLSVIFDMTSYFQDGRYYFRPPLAAYTAAAPTGFPLARRARLTSLRYALHSSSCHTLTSSAFDSSYFVTVSVR